MHEFITKRMFKRLFHSPAKGILVTLLTAMSTLTACQQKQKSSAEEMSVLENIIEDFWEEDSVKSATDDADVEEDELESTETPVAQTVDEVFDDFAFAFDSNRSMQRRRVHFPLTVIHQTDTTLLTKKEWKSPALFMGRDFYTILWTSAAEMKTTQDSVLTEAAVEHINLEEREIVSFDFERDQATRHWMLVRQRTYPFEASDLGDFLDFYRQWSEDSAYQMRHIAHTLRFTMPGENSEENVEGFIDAEQWPEFAPEMPQHVLTNIRYGQNYAKRRTMLLQIRGLSNGLQNVFTFRHDGNRWLLTEFEN